MTIKRLQRDVATSQALLLVNGNVDIEANRIDGFIIATGTIAKSKGGNFQVNGGIWASQIDLNSRNLEVNFDSFFWDNPEWDKRMRVPGMW